MFWVLLFFPVSARHARQSATNMSPSLPRCSVWVTYCHISSELSLPAGVRVFYSMSVLVQTLTRQCGREIYEIQARNTKSTHVWHSAAVNSGLRGIDHMRQAHNKYIRKDRLFMCFCCRQGLQNEGFYQHFLLTV